MITWTPPALAYTRFLQKALEDLERAVQYDPSKAMHFASRGSVLLRLNPPRTRDALTDLEVRRRPCALLPPAD